MWSAFLCFPNYQRYKEFCSNFNVVLPELILHSLVDELFVRSATLYGNLYFMRNLNDFYEPGVKTEFLRRFPFYSFPTEWNFLSSEFKEIAQKSIFKQSLKAKLLDNLKYPLQ